MNKYRGRITFSMGIGGSVNLFGVFVGLHDIFTQECVSNTTIVMVLVCSAGFISSVALYTVFKWVSIHSDGNSRDGW